MHRDRFRENGQPDRYVSTYLAIGRGLKHIILLPPTERGGRVAEALGGAGCDSASGRKESQRVPMPVRPEPAVLESVLDAGGFWFDLEAGDGAGGAEGGRGGDGEAGVETVAAEGSGGERGGSSEDDDESDGGSEGSEGAESADDEPENEPGSISLFIPSGWWHWLSADSSWHCAWSGSIFPEPSRETGEGAEGPPRHARGRHAPHAKAHHAARPKERGAGGGRGRGRGAGPRGGGKRAPRHRDGD